MDCIVAVWEMSKLRPLIRSKSKIERAHRKKKCCNISDSEGIHKLQIINADGSHASHKRTIRQLLVKLREVHLYGGYMLSDGLARISTEKYAINEFRDVVKE